MTCNESKEEEDALPHPAERVRGCSVQEVAKRLHPGGNPEANLESITHRCYLFEVAFVWELTKETIHLPLGCLQGGVARSKSQLCLSRVHGLFSSRQSWMSVNLGAKKSPVSGRSGPDVSSPPWRRPRGKMIVS